MNKQALAIALISAVVGVVLLQLYMRKFEEDARGGAPVRVLAVNKDVKPGTVITRTMLAQRTIPSAYVDQRHIRASDGARVIGQRVSAAVSVNDALLWSDLSMKERGRSLADLVTDGMRAVTIKTSTFDGLLRPGDRVDVVFVSRKKAIEGADGNDTKAVTLLQSVLVLGIKGNISRTGDSEGAGGSVTILVSQEQAQFVLVSQTEGNLELVLRNAEDLELRDDLGTATSDDIRDPLRRVKYLRAHTPSATASAAGEHDGP